MISTALKCRTHPLAAYINRLVAGDALLPDTPENVVEVVGILKSYGCLLYTSDAADE